MNYNKQTVNNQDSSVNQYEKPMNNGPFRPTGSGAETHRGPCAAPKHVGSIFSSKKKRRPGLKSIGSGLFGISYGAGGRGTGSKSPQIKAFWPLRAKKGLQFLVEIAIQKCGKPRQ
ncbi:MAG: hypothetical protein E7423_06310 [Ruminococcaceae bacterium]|nr:hypothetical protein [Oscillospiraceae bacterium]